MKRDLKKSALEVAKLNQKLNKQESLVAKYFGVENELISLRSKVLLKDNEISKLNIQLRQSGLAIPEEASDLEDGSDTS